MTKNRTIIGSDVDEEVLELARQNAKSAGVDDIIQFVQHDILSSYPLVLHPKEVPNSLGGDGLEMKDCPPLLTTRYEECEGEGGWGVR